MSRRARRAIRQHMLPRHGRAGVGCAMFRNRACVGGHGGPPHFHRMFGAGRPGTIRGSQAAKNTGSVSLRMLQASIIWWKALTTLGSKCLPERE